MAERKYAREKEKEQGYLPVSATTEAADKFDSWLRNQPYDIRMVVRAHITAVMHTRKGMGRAMAKELLAQIYLRVANECK